MNDSWRVVLVALFAVGVFHFSVTVLTYLGMPASSSDAVTITLPRCLPQSQEPLPYIPSPEGWGKESHGVKQL